MTKNKINKEMTKAQIAQEMMQEKLAQVSGILNGSEAGDIWNEIKDKNIEMFALPDQKVHMHCRPVPVEQSRLFLAIQSSSVLPSLETAIGNKYTVELADKWVIVSRAVAPYMKK